MQPSANRHTTLLLLPITEKAAYGYIVLAIPGSAFLLFHHFTGSAWARVVGQVLVAPLFVWFVFLWFGVLPLLIAVAVVRRLRRSPPPNSRVA